MNVIIMGAGRIGRGFVTELMTLNNVNITFFDASDEMVKKLNENGKYIIHALGHPDLDVKVNNVKAYSINDIEKFAECWSESSFVFTACGGKNMPSVGKTLGKTFKLMAGKYDLDLSNVVICENWVNPAGDLKKALYAELTEEEKALFDEKVGVCESVILCTGTGAPNPDAIENEMDTWVQNFRYLPIDREPLKGEVPNWEYIEFVENFGNLLTQKLYTNNTSCGSISYLGTLLGKKYMAEAANDPIIVPIMDKIYEEIDAALIQGMHIDAESQYAFSKRAKAKYKDRDIVDLLSRVARDPLRKLRPNDRLIGPSRIALSIGVKPTAIALCTAAALFYYNPEDETSVELKKMRDEKGIKYILENVCCLDPKEELYTIILDSVKELQNRGWLTEEVNF